MRLRIFLSFLMLITATRAETNLVTSATSFLPKFEVLIHKAMQQKMAPGLAVAFVVDGKIIFMIGLGVGEVGRSERVDTHTAFQIGSASRAITSVLAAILVRDGLVSL